MVPGFVLFGSLAILFQLLIIGGIYWYVQRRQSLADSAVRSRVRWFVFGGMSLVGVGQFLALGSIGSLRIVAILTPRQALLVQDAGLLVAVVGYLLVSVGFVQRARRTA